MLEYIRDMPRQKFTSSLIKQECRPAAEMEGNGEFNFLVICEDFWVICKDFWRNQKGIYGNFELFQKNFHSFELCLKSFQISNRTSQK